MTGILKFYPRAHDSAFTEAEPRDINGPVLDGSAPYQGDKNDNINPSHYKKKDYEVINLTRHLGFREGNIVKYVSRHKEKGGKEDILKAMWYLEDLLATYEYNDNNGIDDYHGC